MSDIDPRLLAIGAWNEHDNICLACVHLKISVTDAQIDDIIAYHDAHRCPVFHAIAAVTGSCCHCVRCLNRPKEPRS